MCRRSLVSSFLLLALSLILCGCDGGTSNKTKSRLLGRWREQGSEHTYEFFDNGTVIDTRSTLFGMMSTTKTYDIDGDGEILIVPTGQKKEEFFRYGISFSDNDHILLKCVGVGQFKPLAKSDYAPADEQYARVVANSVRQN